MQWICKAVAAMLLTATLGCAAARQNLGNNQVDIPGVGAVPVETVARWADIARPGAGAAIRMGEAGLQDALGRTPQGPFGGLPYTTARQVVLKNGTVITEAEIERIVEILTPIVPAAIVRVGAPPDYVTAPVATAADPAPATADVTAAVDPDVAAALDKL